jgi:1-deoxy-D-xylulose-5-phosphate synthase
MIPVAAIYSTFLQRAYDQIIHDVALTSRPVVFCLDRGGLAGSDGATHQGAFDLSYLRCIPNLVIMAPKDEDELRHMLRTAIERRDGPTAIRYPRGNAEGVAIEPEMRLLPIGQGEVLREGGDVALFAVGKMVYHALKVADLLAKSGIAAAVVNARFIKPVDHALVARFARAVGHIVTLEENVIHGGFGAAVAESLHDQELHGTRLKIIGLPDRYIEGGEVHELWAEVGLDAASIAATIRDRVTSGSPRQGLLRGT